MDAPIDIIDLRSDTVTQPTPAMRKAMAEAPVGDEQKREDPTVNRLVERVAQLLGKEEAVFLPSATMANQIAFCVHGRRSGELIGHRLSHPMHFEGGGLAFLAGLMLRALDGPRGMFTPADVESAVRPAADPKQQPSRVLLVENTTNLGGGAPWPREQAGAAAAAAHRHGLACHLDGSRLLNAVVATGTPADDYARSFDSVTLCFSKGLGAPTGACLAGDAAFIREAWRYKHMFGGAMRQAGVLAAAALYALDYHVERLAEDHRNARRLAEAIAVLPGIRLDPAQVETNIIVFDVAPDFMPAKALAEKMGKSGVLFNAIGPQTARLVTHLDATAEMIDEAIARFRAANP